MDPDSYKGIHWQYLPKGAHSGQFGGITFLLDVESFEYSYTDKASVGLRIALSDQRDKPMITQDGYLISPGILRNMNMNIIYINIMSLKSLLMLTMPKIV
jgi:hypothetical protein